VITAGRPFRTSHPGSSSSSNSSDDGGGHPGGPTAVGVVASNFTLALSAPPTFVLRVSAERRVAGEERSWTDAIVRDLEERAENKVSGGGGLVCGGWLWWEVHI